jgi:hypothetical protein
VGDRALPIVERRLATASKGAVEAAGGLAACKSETGLSHAQISRCCATHEPDNLSLRNALRIDRLGRGVEGYPEILNAFAAELGCAVIILPTVDGGAEGLPLTVCELALRLESWGTQETLTPPAGFVKAEKHEHARMWNTIRNNGIDVHVLAGINPKGELVIHPSVVFVPEAQQAAVAPAQAGHTPPTPEQQAAAARERGVKKWQHRLAVGPFTGTAFEGRAYWTDGYHRQPEPKTIDGKPGWLVPVDIFVTDEQIAAQREEAEREYDRAEAERAAIVKAREETEAAEEVRRQEILAMDPPPAVVVVDGLPIFRQEDGSYDGDDNMAFASIEQLVDGAERAGDELGAVFATVELYEAAMAAAGGDA